VFCGWRFARSGAASTLLAMLLRRVAFPDFCEPCLPSPATKPPAGAGWLHEIKHDGFRMLVRRDTAGVRLFTRNGHDWTGRFPLIARAALSLKAVSCLIDGEAVACDDDGMPCFDRLRYRRADGHVFLYAFDLIELDGDGLRREPIERRKVLLIRLLAKASVGCRLTTISLSRVTWCFAMLVYLVWKASYRSASARPTALAAHSTGSRARIRQRPL
jgi:ATP-dependent DNA ligase